MTIADVFAGCPSDGNQRRMVVSGVVVIDHPGDPDRMDAQEAESLYDILGDGAT
jgi:hypothetical protein